LAQFGFERDDIIKFMLGISNRIMVRREVYDGWAEFGTPAVSTGLCLGTITTSLYHIAIFFIHTESPAVTR